MVWLGDRYRLVERLGAGGMSVVWRAFDDVLGRPVAVKMLAGDRAGNPAFRLDIRREARAAAQLNHPRIGVVYDYGESREGRGRPVPYVVMELIDGPALSERLGAGPLPWQRALTVCAQVAEGLDAAHTRGLAHRDVTPAPVSARFTGGYQETNAMPAAFTAGGRPCSPVLIGPSAKDLAVPAAAPSSTSGGTTGAKPANGGGQQQPGKVSAEKAGKGEGKDGGDSGDQ
jgi:serine/threonine protein kinase